MKRYINVKKAIEAINDLPNCPNGHSDTYDKACIIGTLEDVPTDDVVERKRGKWLEPTRENCITFDKHAYAECSACGGKSYLGWWMHYCPSCGAEMVEWNRRYEPSEQERREDDEM